MEDIVVAGDIIMVSYLSCKKDIFLLEECCKGFGKFIEFKGVSGNNFKDVDIKILLGIFICVMGVLGSGKLMLINEILYFIL